MRIVESKLWDFGIKVYDLIIINLLWMIFSLPIITIGPATYAGIKSIKDLEDYGQNNIFTLYIKNIKDRFFIYSISFNTFSGILLTSLFLLIKLFNYNNILLNATMIFFIIESLACVWSLFKVDYESINDLIINSFIYSNKNFTKIFLNILSLFFIFVITINIPIFMSISFSLCMFIYNKCRY